VSVVTALVVPFAAGKWSPMVSFGLLLAFWIVASTIVNLRERGRGVRGGVAAQLARQPRHYWGMIVAHLGIAIFIVGVTMVKGYETERDVRMAVGDTINVGGFTLRFDGTTEVTGPNYRAMRGGFDVARNGEHYATLNPEKRLYNAGGQPMTEAAIHNMLTGDLYVSLGEAVDGGAWGVRVYHKPFVTWIWAGCLLMAIGGLLALSDRRYRVAMRRDDTALGRGTAVGD
jgi:cytochrome c-type biogenesis protein CcmF